MSHDVIIVGGGYAGMAAALQLLRARRKVCVVDSGQRRNRFASQSHGFLGQDGISPDRIAADARAQLEAYPTLVWHEAGALSLTGERNAFVVRLEDETEIRGRRVLFATGVRDILPEIDGLGLRWGKSVFHCPYCHGYELNEGRIGVIGTGPMSAHQAELLSEWGSVTFFTNCAVRLEDSSRQCLQQRGVVLEETSILKIEGEADVQLVDGRTIPFAGLFVATTVTPASPLPLKVGCLTTETPIGLTISTDDTKQTSVPGIYACGDVARIPHSVSLSVGDGALAGMQLHRSFVWPE